MYQVKVTGSNGRIKNAWVRVTNISKSINAPTITLEPTAPNGYAGWYKKTKEAGKETEVDTKVKVIITANNNDAEYIYYTAIRWI